MAKPHWLMSFKVDSQYFIHSHYLFQLFIYFNISIDFFSSLEFYHLENDMLYVYCATKKKKFFFFLFQKHHLNEVWMIELYWIQYWNEMKREFNGTWPCLLERFENDNISHFWINWLRWERKGNNNNFKLVPKIHPKKKIENMANKKSE